MPEFYDPTTIAGRFFGIIVINPYHYINRGSGKCGEWLAEPIINSIYSNKMWIIEGLSHQIKEGSFQTLFDCHLLAPGVDINPGQPLGCKGSGSGKKI